jgi:putative molybdopterin biosynthesis protein
MDPLVLRPEEAATVLRVSRSKVYELVATGVLPAVRIGNSVRIPTEQLRLWVEDQVRPAAPAQPGQVVEQEDGIETA